MRKPERWTFFFTLLLLVTVGMVYAQTPEPEEKIDPVASSYINYMKARLAELSGNREAAEAYYQAAIRSAKDPQIIYVDLGTLYKRMGKWDKALKMLQEAVRLDPNDARAYRELGEVYEMRSLVKSSKNDRKKALENYRAYLERIEKPDNRILLRVLTTLTGDNEDEKAISWAETFVEKWPDNIELWRFLAHRYERRGDLEAAEKAFRKWVELDPDSIEAWQAWTRFLIDHHREDEAVEGLQHLWNLKPGNVDLLRALVRAYREQRKFESAEKLVKTYLDDHPGDSQAYRMLVDIVADRDGPSPAIEYLDRLIEEHSELKDEWEFMSGRLWLLYRARRYREAIQLADQLLVYLQSSQLRVPEGTMPRYQRMIMFQKGLMLSLLGELDQAVPVLRSAMKLQDSPEIREVLISTLLELGRLEEAQKELKTAETRFPDAQTRWTILSARLDEERGDISRALNKLESLPEDEAWKEKILLYHRQGLFTEALVLVNQILEAHPEDPDALFYKASTLERLKRYEESTRVFRKLLEAYPDNARALNYLGYMWIEQGVNLDEAIQLVNRALELDPENPAYLDSLAWGYYRRGDYAKARYYIDETLRRMDTDPLILDHAGDIYHALKEYDKAMHYWQLALEYHRRQASNPDFRADLVREKIRRVCDEHPLPRCSTAVTRVDSLQPRP